jgi:hypothetical protein
LSTLTRLTAAGYTAHPAAEEFLAEFAGLRLVHDPTVTLPTGTVRTSFTVFDPYRAANPMEVNWTRHSAQALGLSLCPIGTDSFHSTLHLADDGSVHSANGSRVYTFAKDVPGFLALLATGDRPHFVLDWSTQSSDFASNPASQPPSEPDGKPRALTNKKKNPAVNQTRATSGLPSRGDSLRLVDVGRDVRWGHGLNGTNNERDGGGSCSGQGANLEHFSACVRWTAGMSIKPWPRWCGCSRRTSPRTGNAGLALWIGAAGRPQPMSRMIFWRMPGRSRLDRTAPTYRLTS